MYRCALPAGFAVVLAIALSAGMSAPAHAEVLFIDYFSYPDGPLDNQGEWFDTSQITIYGGVAEHSGLGDGPGLVFNAKHDVPEQGAVGTVVWIAMRADQLVDDAVSSSFGGLGLFDGTIERLMVGKSWPGDDVWSLIKQPGNVIAATDVDMSTGKPTVVILRITYGLFTDVADLWVDPINPAFLGEPDAALTGSFGFNRLLLRSGNGGDCRFAFDTLAMGDALEGLLDPEPDPPCPGDVNNTGEVGFPDLVLVLAAWGDCPGCPEDADGNGAVDFGDLLIVLADWGPCP